MRKCKCHSCDTILHVGLYGGGSVFFAEGNEFCVRYRVGFVCIFIGENYRYLVIVIVEALTLRLCVGCKANGDADKRDYQLFHRGYLKTVHFISTSTLSSITVAACIERILERKHERAVIGCIEFINCYVLIKKCDITIALVENIVGFKCHTKTIIKERFIQLGIEI